MRSKTIYLFAILTLLVSLPACTFQHVSPEGSPSGTNPTSEIAPLTTTAAPSAGDIEPGEQDLAPVGTEEVLPSPPITTEDPWAEVTPDSGDFVLWYALPSQSPVDLAFNRLVDDFNAQNTYGMTIHAFNLGTLEEVSNRTLPLLDTPDVPALVMLPTQDVQTHQDALLLLNTLLDSPTWGIPPEERVWTTSLLANGPTKPLSETNILALPLGTDAYGMALNANWAARLGVYNTPATPDEFSALACKATQRPFLTTGQASGYVLVPSLTTLHIWTQAFGGQLYDPDQDLYRFDQPATVEAMTFLQDLYRQKCLTLAEDDATAERAFQAGETLLIPAPVSVLHPNSPWQAAIPFNWQVDTLPGGSLVPTAKLQFTIPKNSPARELAAFLFLKYALQPTNQTQFVNGSAYFPLNVQSVAQSDLPSRYGRLYKALLVSPPYAAPPLLQDADKRIAQTIRNILQGTNPQNALEKLQAGLK